MKDLKGYNLNILELYYGKTELSPDICDDIENFIYDVKKQRLDYMFPIANIESKEKFKPLSASKAVNFVTWGIPVLLTPEIGFLARKNRANELNKFETRSGIKMFNKGNIKLLSDTTLYELCKSFDIASGCPIIMNDNSYTGDVELKERVEAYAYENNVSIIYLKEA